MKRLCHLIEKNEDWLIESVLQYAKNSNYVKYTSTLREAWRKSIAGLSFSLLKLLHIREDMPELSPDHDYAGDQAAAFCIKQMQKHQQMGINLQMFLGLLKYYRQSYIDLVLQAGFERAYEEQCRLYINRYFDCVELGVCHKWSITTDSEMNSVLQAANRTITNEKNRYLTLCESMPYPVIMLGEDNNIAIINHSAVKLFKDSYIPGESYYSGHQYSEIVSWLSDELIRFNSAGIIEESFEKNLETASVCYIFIVKLKRMLDVTGKFAGTVVILNDVTDLRKTEEKLGESNKELTAANEELIATNEELVAVEEELRQQLIELERNRESLDMLNRQLQDIIEFLPDATFVVDESKKVIAWNREIEEMTGVTKEEIIGRGNHACAVPIYGHPRPILVDLVFSEDKKTEQFYDNLRREGNTLYGESYAPCVRAGAGAFLWIKASPLFNSKGKMTGAIQAIRDITNLRHAQDQLLQEKERLDVTLSSIGDGVLAIDTSGMVTLFNPVAESLTGWAREEAMGRPLGKTFSIVNERTGQSADHQVYAAFTDGKAAGLKNHIALISRQGIKRSIAYSVAQIKDNTGKMLGAILVFRDVTAERHMQEALKKSEERFRLLAENAWDILYRVELYPDIRFTYVSPASTIITGYAPEDYYAESNIVYDMVYPGDKSLLKSLFNPGNDYSKPMAIRFIRKDGQVIWAEISSVPTYDDSGQLVAMEGIARDITKRKQWEEVLKKYHLLFHSARDIILFIQKDGRIIEANDTAVRMYGYSREELLNMSIFDIPKTQHSVIESQIEEAFTKGILFETEHLRKDGSSFPVEVQSQGALLDKEQVILSIIRDISERKLAERKLRESGELNRTVLSSLMSNIAVLDKDGVIVAVNKAWSIFAEENGGDLSLQVGIGLNYLGICSKARKEGADEAKAALAGIQGVVDKSLKEFILEYPCNSPVQKRWFMLYATPLSSQSGGAVVSHIDITRRKLAEEELSEEKERLSVTLRSIGEGVITTDNEGSVILINRVAEKLTGWSQEEAAGKPLDIIYRIINERTRERYKNLVKRILGKEIPYPANNILLKARDGKEKEIAQCAMPIFDKNIDTIGVVLVFRDISQIRKMELEALRSNKLESISILAGGIAHDFNNILTAITGNISLAKMYSSSSQETIDVLDEIEKASIRARELTQQLLTFAKGGLPIKKTASVAELLREISSFVLRGTNVKCEFVIPESLWPAEIDRGQISQVINNLIINAQQAMPEGGTVIIECENVIISDKRHLPLTKGKYVKMTIKDTGIGISRQYLQKIFDPYFTTKQKGSGLGLAVSHSIIKKHGGYITVESVIGSGSAFSIILPASKGRVKSEREKQQMCAGSGKILIIDDEEMVRKVAGRMLKHLGYRVEYAVDGAEGIKKYMEAMTSEKSFDAVIMDLTIPGGMGGKEAVKNLLEIDSGVKAIVSSGYSNDPVMANFSDYGFKGVVVKPFRLDELSKTIHEVLTCC